MSISSAIENQILKQLTIIAGNIAEDAKRNASWSSTIPDAIEVGKAQKTQDGQFIEVIVNLKTAPHAAAFEYGSGEHAEKGNKNRYRIEPKESSVLVFPWQPDFIPWQSPKFAGVQRTDRGSTEGTYFFNWVDHPGVMPNPYLRPAIDKNLDSIRTKLLAAFIRGYINFVPKFTVIK